MHLRAQISERCSCTQKQVVSGAPLRSNDLPVLPRVEKSEVPSHFRGALRAKLLTRFTFSPPPSPNDSRPQACVSQVSSSLHSPPQRPLTSCARSSRICRYGAAMQRSRMPAACAKSGEKGAGVPGEAAVVESPCCAKRFACGVLLIGLIQESRGRSTVPPRALRRIPRCRNPIHQTGYYILLLKYERGTGPGLEVQSDINPMI